MALHPDFVGSSIDLTKLKQIESRIDYTLVITDHKVVNGVESYEVTMTGCTLTPKEVDYLTRRYTAAEWTHVKFESMYDENLPLSTPYIVKLWLGRKTPSPQ